MENQKKPLNDVAVVSSSEENSGRETEVDEEEVRTPVFGTESDENLHLGNEAPLARPTPSDRPYDISPLTESDDGLGMGMVDQSDEKTMAEYERGAKEDAKKRTLSKPRADHGNVIVKAELRPLAPLAAVSEPKPPAN